MVKKFISGILGKKGDEAKAGESKEEVPDELPPLAEEIIAKSQAAQPKKEPMPEKGDVPEELPPLGESFPQGRAEEGTEGTLEDLEKETIPDEIKKAKLAKIKPPESKAGFEAKESVQRQKEDYSVNERIKAGAEAGFFSNILDHIKRHGGAKEKLLVGDLFSRMGNYWELRKHEIKSGTLLPAEKKLEDDLTAKLEELKSMEQKWQVQKLALEEDLKFIHEREREIQAKIKELILVSNELALFRNVKPEEYFHMHNGVLLKSLHDLIDILEVVDDQTFEFHVKGNKNDFSSWIRHVFKNDNLADKIKNAKTKMDIIEVLERTPMANEDDERKKIYMEISQISPKKYFWLANGSVIRNIYELSDVLRAMDDGLFNKHVGENKNDFAAWARNVLKNEHLAEKLDKATTKKSMMDILEVFL